MKKLFGVLTIALLLLVATSATSEAQIRFGFKGTGGLNYLSGGDLNKAAEGFTNHWTGLFTLLGLSPEGEFAKVGLGMNFGGEFLLQFSPELGFGLGVGYLASSKTSEIKYTPASPPVELIWNPSVSAIPITATFYYFLPSSGNMKFFINAGAGYYLAKADYEHSFWLIAPIVWDAKTSGGGIGFHGGLGLEYSLSPQFGIVFEVKGRYAAFSNFEGSVNWSFPGTGLTSFTEEGKLWILDYNLGAPLGTEPWVWIEDTKPANATEAKVDFSGFSFVVGFIVRFGS